MPNFDDTTESKEETRAKIMVRTKQDITLTLNQVRKKNGPSRDDPQFHTNVGNITNNFAKNFF